MAEKRWSVTSVPIRIYALFDSRLTACKIHTGVLWGVRVKLDVQILFGLLYGPYKME